MCCQAFGYRLQSIAFSRSHLFPLFFCLILQLERAVINLAENSCFIAVLDNSNLGTAEWAGFHLIANTSCLCNPSCSEKLQSLCGNLEITCGEASPSPGAVTAAGSQPFSRGRSHQPALAAAEGSPAPCLCGQQLLEDDTSWPLAW